ncbi:MAG: RNA polymerase sigma factor [Lawsonibacter sp.]|nr:RNA polymerase sigma factor [Lawsonibacter sp.]
MEDHEIVALYWNRDEEAIAQTQRQYGGYLYKIAWQVLAGRPDSEEIVNDTYLKAWNSIPPHRPGVLRTYLGKITRQLSIDRLRGRGREKRRGSEYALSLSELEECVSAGDTTQEQVDLRLLAESIEDFLATLPPESRTAFVGRYYYLDPIRDIAGYQGMSQSKVKSLLYRTRQGLRHHLEQEGFFL